MYRDIKDFHEKFGIKPISDRPMLLPDDIMQFRLKFLHEELVEMIEAYQQGDLPQVADAIVDIIYVALGTAYRMGLPFDELWQEVHNCNMAKIRVKSAIDSKRYHSDDIIKPEGWQPPCISKILEDYHG